MQTRTCLFFELRSTRRYAPYYIVSEVCTLVCVICYSRIFIVCELCFRFHIKKNEAHFKDYYRQAMLFIFPLTIDVICTDAP